MKPSSEAWTSVIITALLAGVVGYQAAITQGLRQPAAVIAGVGAMLLAAQGHFRSGPLDTTYTVQPPTPSTPPEVAPKVATVTAPPSVGKTAAQEVAPL
jgi:hypothetical protein